MKALGSGSLSWISAGASVPFHACQGYATQKIVIETNFHQLLKHAIYRF